MDIKPLRRIEHFLAKIAGSKYAKDLTPITRKEYWLNEIAKNGGGSGGGTKIVNITEGSDNQWSADATFSEMLSAYQSGKTILFSIRNATAIATYHAESGGPDPIPANFVAYLFEPRGLIDAPAVVAFGVIIEENDVHVEFGEIS